ncbi:MAG: LexA family protein [Parasutterella sp.]
MRRSGRFPFPGRKLCRQVAGLNEYLVANPASTFFVYVTGDSMDLAGMDEGDLLVVDRSPEPKNGDIVIMSINNEFTVKRYMKDDKGLRLLPESSNPIYKPILPKDFDEWRFIGVVKYTIKSN